MYWGIIYYMLSSDNKKKSSKLPLWPVQVSPIMNAQIICPPINSQIRQTLNPPPYQIQYHQNGQPVVQNFNVYEPLRMPVPNHGQMVPSHGQMVPNHMQMVPNHRQMVPNHGQMVPNHRQMVPSQRQMVPNYRQIAPKPRQMVPNHRVVNGQLVPNHQAPPVLNLPNNLENIVSNYR